MTPSDKDYLIDFVSRLSKGLGEALGKHCEIVVHDLRAPESSIIAIVNGNVTGRAVGDTLDVLGFQLLKTPPASDLFNYRTQTKEGKALRSSTVFLRDESGQIFGAMCINVDVSAFLKVYELLQHVIGSGKATIDEGFEHTVDEVLETLIQNAISSIGKNISDLTREDKIAVVRYLESRGTFLIRYSVERVAELLNMTKFTIYNYMDQSKKRQEAAEVELSKTT